jgi:hypothetical protein
VTGQPTRARRARRRAGPRDVAAPPARRRPAKALFAVVVALVAGAAASQGVTALQERDRQEEAPRGTSAVVRTATLACPAPAVSGSGTTSTVFLAVPPQNGGSGAGEATLADIGRGTPRIKSTVVGGGSLDVSARGIRPQVARAQGALAPGLTAELVTQAGRGAGRGLSSVACVAPSNDFWFVGGGSGAGRVDRLYLTNVDSTPAVTDVQLWSDRGPLTVPNTRAITIRPGEQRVLRLDGMASGRARLAVAISVSVGRLAAALHDQDSPGLSFHGTDWIAPSAAPTRQLVVPGVPGGPVSRRLQILAPGGTDAIVKVRLIAKDRAFAPVGLDTLQLRAGTVAEFDIDKSAAGQPLAVRLDSDQPVVAAVRVTRGSGTADTAYATAATPLTGPTVVADARGGRRGSTRLQLSAPEQAAAVVLTALVPNKAPAPRVVTVPAGRTVTLDPTPRGVERYALVVVPRPGSGPLYVARELAGPSPVDLTIAPLDAGRFRVVIPTVVHDLSAGLRAPSGP